MPRLIKNRTERSGLRFPLYGVIAFSTFILHAVPAFAVRQSNSTLADPAEYFPDCTCTVAFLSFILLALALLIIAMFQYGEKREKKLSPVAFTVIGIILVFIIYSISLGGMAYILRPSSFPLDPETGTYKFSMDGERGTEDSPFRGEYNKEELAKHIRESRTYIVTSWAIMSIACVGALAFVPRFLRWQAEKKEEKKYPSKRRRRSTKGRIGTRTVRDKKDKAGGRKEGKGKKEKKR